MKANTIHEAKLLTHIPNIGKEVAADLELLGIHHPKDLIGKDGYELYKDLCRKTGSRHDPCVLDTFMAVADFASGAPARPWFAYTATRKQKYKV